MIHSIRHLVAMTTATIVLCFVGGSAAFAGPAPIIEPQYAPPATSPAPTAAVGGGFPWLITAGSIALVIVVVGLAAVVWHRAHDTHHGLVAS